MQKPLQLLTTLLCASLLAGCDRPQTEPLPIPATNGRYLQLYFTAPNKLKVEAALVRDGNVRRAGGVVDYQSARIGHIAALTVPLDHCDTVTFGQQGSDRDLLIAVPAHQRIPDHECQIGDWSGDWQVLRQR